jgi:hypothetical protein
MAIEVVKKDKIGIIKKVKFQDFLAKTSG